MEKKAFFRPSHRLLAPIAALTLAVAPVQAAEMQWVWSPSSALVNQSTEALVEGRFVHAIRFANATLRSKTDTVNYAIARHNLCIATLARNAAKAQPLCAAALESETAAQIAQTQGRWMATDAAEGAPSAALDDTLRANIARAQGPSALAQKP